MRNSKPLRGRKAPAAAASLAALVLFTGTAALTAAFSRLNADIPPLTEAETALARGAWFDAYRGSVSPWPDAPDLTALRPAGTGGAGRGFSGSLHAPSAVLIDASNGAVLFERDADRVIPPASMTKLVAMYVAFREIAEGRLSLEESLVPPEPSWAENIPPRSSLMFLGKGQRLTVDELLRGMAVVSGNDAAVALAERVSAGVEPFVARMNSETERLGLARTRFVEPTGLSERNSTTAREFANFALRYLREAPEALSRYHGLRSLTYPQERNLPKPGEGSSNSNPVLAGQVPITQTATNPLLGNLEGCDGLKTGYIDESGYNLALTARRGNTRFISVTMGTEASGPAEGNRFRAEDGRALMEWAFANWKTVYPDRGDGYRVIAWGSGTGAVRAVPALTEALTVPANAPDKPSVRLVLPREVFAPVEAGAVLGRLEYLDGAGTVIAEVPLIADRNAPAGALPLRMWERAVRLASLALRGSSGAGD